MGKSDDIFDIEFGVGIGLIGMIESGDETAGFGTSGDTGAGGAAANENNSGRFACLGFLLGTVRGGFDERKTFVKDGDAA